MQKYSVKNKLYKQLKNTYFLALDSQGQSRLIRKAYLPALWTPLLASKQIALLKSNSHPLLGSLVEILKENNKFFLIYQNCQENLLEYVRKGEISFKQRLQIAQQILGLVRHILTKHTAQLKYIRTDSFFIRTSLPILVQLDGIQDSTDIDFCYSAPEVILGSTCDKSIVFSLGCLFSQIFLGQNLLTAKNQIDYMYQLCSLFPLYFQGKGKSNSPILSSQLNFASITQSLPPYLTRMLAMMLQYDQVKRISLDKINLNEATVQSIPKERLNTLQPKLQKCLKAKKKMPMQAQDDILSLNQGIRQLPMTITKHDAYLQDQQQLRVEEIDSDFDMSSPVIHLKKPMRVKSDQTPIQTKSKPKNTVKQKLRSSQSINQDSFNRFKPVLNLISRPLHQQRFTEERLKKQITPFSDQPAQPKQNKTRVTTKVSSYGGNQLTNYAKMQGVRSVDCRQHKFVTQLDMDD